MRNTQKDERILKENNKITAPLYVLILLLTFIVSITKYMFIAREFSNYILELIATVTSIGYLFFKSLFSRIPIFSSPDECIKELQNVYRAHSFFICFWVYIIGEFILILVPGQEHKIVGLYFLIWFIPSIIISSKSIKRGLLIWGSKSREKKGLTSLKKSVLIGGLFFGIFTGRDYLWKDGIFQPTEIVFIIGIASCWSILFYFIMKMMISKGEKNSKKELEDDIK